MDNRKSDLGPDGRPETLTEVEQAAREHTRAAIETLVGIINNDNAPTSARVAAARMVLGRTKTPYADALRDAVMRAGEDGLCSWPASPRCVRGDAPARLPKPRLP
jgi:hypothetical protein